MSATNTTTNYQLSQFIGTDKPAWLVDYNGDMGKIDTAIKNAADAASAAASTAGTADGKADTNAGNISTLDSQINTPTTGLAAVVSGHTTDISGINGKIGNTPLPTTAQTLTGAIDEISLKIGTTPLPTTAQTLTGAIDEIYSGSGSDYVAITPTPSETWTSVLDRLFALIDTTKISSKSRFVRVDGSGGETVHTMSYNSSTKYTFIRAGIPSANNKMEFGSVGIQATGSFYRYSSTTSSNTTFTDASNSDASSYTFKIYY